MLTIILVHSEGSCLSSETNHARNSVQNMMFVFSKYHVMSFLCHHTENFCLCYSLLEVCRTIVICVYINSAQTKKFPGHRFIAKPAHRLSTDSVITHLVYPFVVGLPIVNTSQYQLVYAFKCSILNGSYLLITSFQVILIEMGEIIRAATLRGVFVIDLHIDEAELVINF